MLPADAKVNSLLTAARPKPVKLSEQKRVDTEYAAHVPLEVLNQKLTKVPTTVTHKRKVHTARPAENTVTLWVKDVKLS